MMLRVAQFSEVEGSRFDSSYTRISLQVVSDDSPSENTSYIRAGGDRPERRKRHAAGHSASYC